MPILTECFLFNDIFNVENISLPKSFSFGSCTSFPPSLRSLREGQGEVRFCQSKSEVGGVPPTSTALVTNTKVQRLAQSAEDVNDLLAPRWVKNNKSRYFMPSPQPVQKPSVFDELLRSAHGCTDARSAPMHAPLQNRRFCSDTKIGSSKTFGF